jgi:hypothetical protein
MCFQPFPEPFHRVELWRIRRQELNLNIVRHSKTLRFVPACLIHNQFDFGVSKSSRQFVKIIFIVCVLTLGRNREKESPVIGETPEKI